MAVTFVLIGVGVILWVIACVVFRAPFARGMKKFNDAYYNGFLQPPDVPPEIVALSGVVFVGVGITLILTALLGHAG